MKCQDVAATAANEARECNLSMQECDVLPDFTFYFVLLLGTDGAVTVIEIDRTDLLRESPALRQTWVNQRIFGRCASRAFTFTIDRAMCVALLMSDEAPLVTFSAPYAASKVSSNSACYGEALTDFLGDTTAHADVDIGEVLLVRTRIHVIFGQLTRLVGISNCATRLRRNRTYHSERMSAGHACHLVQGHRAVCVKRNERVAAFVVRRHLLHVVANESTLPLSTHDDAILGPLEVLQLDGSGVFSGGLDGSHAKLG